MEHFLALVTKPDNVPILAILFLIPYFMWLSYWQARQTDITGVPSDAALNDKVYVWPYLCRNEFICAIIVMLVLGVWSIMIDAPLEEPSDPTKTPNPSKAPWYFLALQEMLVYFDPWIAGVVLPGLIIAGLIAIPYIDINPKGKGYYTIKERPFALAVFLLRIHRSMDRPDDRRNLPQRARLETFSHRGSIGIPTLSNR